MLKKQATVLIVDDTSQNIDLLREILHDDYHVKAAITGEQALALLAKNPDVDIILLDIMMPGMDGFEVCKCLKADPALSSIPVIFITAMTAREDEAKGLSLGAVDYITKPINPATTKARVQTHLALKQQQNRLEIMVKERTQELESTRLSIIQRLGRAAEYKDNETGLHTIRMSHYARLIAQHMAPNNEEWVDLVYQAAPMHDIGKIGISDAILLKEGPLSDDEWSIMKQHPIYGAEIIGESDSKLLQMAREVAIAHHEKFDGSGYPYGLHGEDIPLCARIIAVADVFDSLTSKRSYKEAWSFERAHTLIIQERGKHFDPKVVSAFEAVIDEVIPIYNRLKEE